MGAGNMTEEESKKFEEEIREQAEQEWELHYGHLSPEELESVMKYEAEQEELYQAAMDERDAKTEESARIKEIEYRGRIISAFVRVEDSITHFIADYFCEDKEKAKYLRHLFLAKKFDVSMKVTIFGFILNNSNVQGQVSKYKWVVPLLHELIEDRNAAAHRTMYYDLFNHLKDGNIEFLIQTTDKKKAVTLARRGNESNVIEIEEDCKKILAALREIKNEIEELKKSKGTM